MIHVVTYENQHLYPRQLDQMFRMRHEFYIEGHGWSGLTSSDGKETDEFDSSDAVYLMSIDARGDVAASVRLNPTTGPTLLQKFADYSLEPLPEASDVWDISRWIAKPEHRRGDSARWRTNHQRELMIGILEFCLSRGLSRLTMLSEFRLADRIETYGWPIRFLGKPQAYEGGKGVAVAAVIHVGHQILAFTRQKTGVMKTVLVHIDPAGMPALDASRQTAAAEAAVIESIGVGPIRRLVRAIAEHLASTAPTDTAQAIDLIDAFSRMLKSASAAIDPRLDVDAADTVAVQANSTDKLARDA